MLSAWLVSARAPTWNTTGKRLPEMTCRTSFISTSPWPAVKFVTRPPARAKPSAAEADECSLSGSRKTSGVPHRLARPSATAAWYTAGIVVDGVIGYEQAASLIRVSTEAIASDPSQMTGSPGYRNVGPFMRRTLARTSHDD